MRPPCHESETYSLVAVTANEISAMARQPFSAWGCTLRMLHFIYPPAALKWVVTVLESVPQSGRLGCRRDNV